MIDRVRACRVNGRRNQSPPVFLYAFDLLELGGVDFGSYPLEERRGRLQYLLRKANGGAPLIRWSSNGASPRAP